MPAKVAARESAGCWMTGMALLLLTKSACQLLLRPPRRVPASAFRPSAKHAAGNYHAKKERAPGAEAFSSRASGNPLGLCCRDWQSGHSGFKEMTQKRRGPHEIRVLPGDKLHAMKLR